MWQACLLSIISIGAAKWPKAFEILQESFEEWGPNIAASVSAMVHASSLCPKNIKEKLLMQKRTFGKVYKIRRWNKFCRHWHPLNSAKDVM